MQFGRRGTATPDTEAARCTAVDPISGALPSGCAPGTAGRATTTKPAGTSTATTSAASPTTADATVCAVYNCTTAPSAPTVVTGATPNQGPNDFSKIGG
ncbi:hypothetical protein TTY48_21290 [Tsukamurella sp. TY48]|nr:hypothetical protein TTY48_21290 [Tsukamurella sp. TY48]